MDNQTYFSYRESLDKAELEMSGRYDRWIITLSAGALALSITFIKEIAPCPIACSVFALKVSWIFLGASLLSALVSLLTSQQAIRDFRNDFEEMRNNGIEQPAPKMKFAKLTNWLNWSSAVLFICGVVALCVFSVENIPIQKEKQEMSNDRPAPQRPEPGSIKTGYVPPPPAKIRRANNAWVRSSPTAETSNAICEEIAEWLPREERIRSQ
ncbi:MAG: hypothetical protein NTY53_04140 [Kiritimatiellaeota bacterium]|nr:hypothetical protein [Kiritimatiellota bacterium]